ncbi:hypothetical protein H0W80_04955 [Candidatus Saccharibacteria bacterium]|nr:hypothetical protein [Candidatus Saccharibacteria bacterium]
MQKSTRRSRSKKTIQQKPKISFSIWSIGIFAVLFVLFGTFIILKSRAATKPNYSIIIVAGQSNADGAEAYVYDPASNFDLFGAKTHSADSETKLVWSNLAGYSGPPPAVLKSIGDPATKYSKNQATFGPEVGLARGLYDQGRRNIIILKVTFGGLGLAQDSKIMDWNVHSNNEAFFFLKSRLKSLNEWVTAQGATSSVDGFYWVQGEADVVPEKAPLYEANLRDLVMAAHTDLGLRADAPFVLAKTSIAAWIQTAQNLIRVNPCGSVDCITLTAADQQVRAAQQKVADTVANVKISDTISLPRHGLNIHLSNVGELALGYAFAQASVGYKIPAPVQQSSQQQQKSSSAGTPARNATQTTRSEGGVQPNITITSDSTNKDTLTTSVDGKTTLNTFEPNKPSGWDQVVASIRGGWDTFIHSILTSLGLR